MKTITLRRPGGLDRLESKNAADAGAPAHGQIRVRIHASSLNFQDLLVVTGRQTVDYGRAPMTDGAGVVEAVDDGVTEFIVDDAVVSTFFPHWPGGGPIVADFATTPGDGVDGYARKSRFRPKSEAVCRKHLSKRATRFCPFHRSECKLSPSGQQARSSLRSWRSIPSKFLERKSLRNRCALALQPAHASSLLQLRP